MLPRAFPQARAYEVRRTTAPSPPTRPRRRRSPTASASRRFELRAEPSVDPGVLVEDAADLLDRLGRGLGRVSRTHNQLGFDAVDVRALVLDDAVVALLDGPRSFHRNDRMRVDAGRDRQRRQRLDEGKI